MAHGLCAGAVGNTDRPDEEGIKTPWCRPSGRTNRETQTDLMKKGLRPPAGKSYAGGHETQTDLMKKGLRLSRWSRAGCPWKHRQT